MAAIECYKAWGSGVEGYVCVCVHVGGGVCMCMWGGGICMCMNEMANTLSIWDSRKKSELFQYL